MLSNSLEVVAYRLSEYGDILERLTHEHHPQEVLDGHAQ